MSKGKFPVVDASLNQLWERNPKTSVLNGLSKKDHDFEANLGYIARAYILKYIYQRLGLEDVAELSPSWVCKALGSIPSATEKKAEMASRGRVGKREGGGNKRKDTSLALLSKRSASSFGRFWTWQESEASR